VEALQRAREDVNRALAIDPDLDAGHSMLAFVEDLAGNDAAADESIARSLRINPNYHYPIMLRVGRLVANGGRDEALAVLERMAEVDPNNFDTLGGLFSLAGDLETSREYYALYTDFAPADVMGHVRLGRIEWILGDIEAAARELRLAETLLGDPPSSAMDAAYLSNSYRLIGLADDGARMAGRLDRATIEALPPWVHVQALLGAGDVERAYALASTMVARRAPLGLSDAFVFAINAYRDPVLEQPRFVALRRRLGYEE
jgi:tetratricopeptide (TPR) repeat protein